MGLFIVFLALPLVLLANSKTQTFFSDAAGIDATLNVCSSGKVRLGKPLGMGLYRTASFNCGTGRTKNYEARLVSSSSSLNEVQWQAKAQELCGCTASTCRLFDRQKGDYVKSYPTEDECSKKCSRDYPGFSCNRPGANRGKIACVRDLCKMDIISYSTLDSVSFSVRKDEENGSCPVVSKYNCPSGLSCEDLIENGQHTGMKITRVKESGFLIGSVMVYKGCKCDALPPQGGFNGAPNLCDTVNSYVDFDIKGKDDLAVGASVYCRFDSETCTGN